MKKSRTQAEMEYRARLRARPEAWARYLARCRAYDLRRRPRKIPHPEEFDWSVVLGKKQRADAVGLITFSEAWSTILFLVPSLWLFRWHCTVLNRRYMLKRKARWINQQNARHVEATKRYNHRPEVVAKRKACNLRIKQATEAIRKTPEYRAKVAEYERLHTARSPQRRISKRLRTRVNRAIKLGGGLKSQSTLALIGCTIPELMRHIEVQFKPGMSWDNYGLHGWHVDHKIPCAAFDLTNEEQQRVCFHHTNLQPMWSTENWSKSSSLPNGLKVRKKPVRV